jgi:hypothetical protein
MIVVSVAMILFPANVRMLQLGWGPLGIAEVGTALWLIIVGIRPPRSSAPPGELVAA